MVTVLCRNEQADRDMLCHINIIMHMNVLVMLRLCCQLTHSCYFSVSDTFKCVTIIRIPVNTSEFLTSDNKRGFLDLSVLVNCNKLLANVKL